MFTRLAPRLSGRTHILPKPAIPRYYLSTKATATPKKKEFLCIMPDKPNVLELRKKVKGAHYEGVKPLVAAGRVVDGGAILKTHPTESNEVQIIGSMVVYTGENAAEVREIIKKDAYATSGVWDLEKVEIWPYFPAVREPVS